jgi:phosphatidate cytidylyltransferase
MSAKWGDLAVRTGSAAVLIPAVLLCVWLGGIWFQLFTLLLGYLIAHEWARIVHPGHQLQRLLHVGAAVAGTLAPNVFSIPVVFLLVIVLAATSSFIVWRKDAAASHWNHLGIFYVGFPVMALNVLRSDSEFGALAIFWICLIVWSADTLAYFSGRMIGGPKLAPLISPKKTWAGFAGAIAGSAIASAGFAYFAQLESVIMLILLAGALAIVEQGGDLFESALKRSFNVKDAGQLIPGHGGVIDRVDGLVAVLVAAVLIGFFRQNGEYAAQGLLIW